MKLQKCAALLMVSSFAVIFSACSPSNQESQLNLTSGHLIGGSVAEYTDFPASVRLVGGCTAAKVAPKLILTAAHCVVDLSKGIVRTNYLNGSSISVQNGTEVYSLKVVETFPHESYLTAVKATLALGNSPNNASKDSYDVAFIAVSGNMDAIPEAEIDLNSVSVADSLIISGYGCEDKLGGVRPNPLRYKIGESYAVDINALKGARGNYSAANTQAKIYQHNILTAGQKLDPKVPSICPGDSGGPVFRANDHRLIVGVNSYYTFNDGSGISYTNWHTRLSNLKTWILDILDARGE